VYERIIAISKQGTLFGAYITRGKEVLSNS